MVLVERRYLLVILPDPRLATEERKADLGTSPGMTSECGGCLEEARRQTRNSRQPVQIRLQHVALEDQAGEFAVAHDLDQAARSPAPSVWCESVAALMSWHRADRAAGEAPVGVADLLQDLVAAGFGEGAGDAGELPVTQAGNRSWPWVTM